MSTSAGDSFRRSAWVALLVYVFVILAAGLVCVAKWRLDTQPLNFLGAGDRAQKAALAMLSRSHFGRTLVFSIGPPTSLAEPSRPHEVLVAARSVAGSLAERPEIAWLSAGPSIPDARRLFDVLFPTRWFFIDDHPERLSGWLTNAALQKRAEQLKQELGSASGSLIRATAAEDPWLLFTKRVAALRSLGHRGLRVDDGQWFTDSGHAVIFVELAPGTDAAAVSRALHTAETAFAPWAAQGLVLERTGAALFAADGEGAARSDLARVTLCSVLIMVALCLVLFRSVLPLLVVVQLLAGALLVAAAVTLLVFGTLHALTLAFGAALLGVAMDYPVHVLNQAAALKRLRPQRALRGLLAQAARDVAPALALACGTTVCALMAMAIVGLGGLVQLAVFASVGLVAAAGTALLVLPALPIDPGSGRFQQRLGRALAVFRQRLTLHPSWVVAAISLVALGAAAGLVQADWVSDMRELASTDPNLLAEQERVLARLGTADEKTVIAMGDDEQQLLARTDALATKLEGLRQQSVIQEFYSLHALLWSEGLQEQNRAALLRPGVLERTVTELVRAGFAQAAFEPLRREWEQLGERPPLRVADLQQAGMGDLLRAYYEVVVSDEVEPGTQHHVSFTRVRGITQPPVLEQQLKTLAGVWLYAPARWMTHAFQYFRVQLALALGVGGLLILILLLARYRRPRLVLGAALPSLLAAAAAPGVLALLGVRLSLFHLMGALIVLGMGVDYGVFLAEEQRRSGQPRGQSALPSIGVGALSTVGAFGALAVSKMPALAAMGQTTALGVGLALLIALLTSRPTSDADHAG